MNEQEKTDIRAMQVSLRTIIDASNDPQEVRLLINAIESLSQAVGDGTAFSGQTRSDARQAARNRSGL